MRWGLEPAHMLRSQSSTCVVIGLGLLVLSCSRTAPSTQLDAGAAQVCESACDDGLFCNGLEFCDTGQGTCAPGTAPCDDGDECTLDSCAETDQRCEHRRLPRDRDGDGHDACEDDCNDDDATIFPGAEELCDLVDQDCDNRTDEGLRSECGDCRPGCRLIHLPFGEVWDVEGEHAEAVGTRDGGRTLVLETDSRQRFDAWIANYWEGTVTKLDTRDGSQLGRYHSALNDGSNGAEPVSVECNRESDDSTPGGNCPSRTAVDLQGAVYVANRAFGRQGTVTKIAGFEADCVDRDGDGEIQTSRDLDGNGRIDRFVEGEFVGQDDECILWTRNVGGNDGVPRALAVTGDGMVWVGLNREQKVVQLDPTDGSRRRALSVAGFNPYGAVADSRGRLWLTEALTGRLLEIDGNTATVKGVREAPATQAGCPSSYGIAVDSQDRVWIAGFTCPFAFRYDPEKDSWLAVPLPDSGVTRGVAADDMGQVYIAASHTFLRLDASEPSYFDASPPVTRLTVFDAEDGSQLRIFGTREDPLPGQGAIGVGLDADRQVWLVNRNSDSATRLNVSTGEAREFAVGALPYTYSDFTGFSLRRLAAPSGSLRSVVEGCSMGPSEWERLSYDAQLPRGTRLQIRLRTAPTRGRLSSARWSAPLDGTPLDLAAGPGALAEERFLEVEARLVSDDRRSTPALRQITIRLHCPI